MAMKTVTNGNCSIGAMALEGLEVEAGEADELEPELGFVLLVVLDWLPHSAFSSDKAVAWSAELQVELIHAPAEVWKAVLAQRHLKSVSDVQPLPLSALVLQLRTHAGMFWADTPAAAARAKVKRT